MDFTRASRTHNPIETYFSHLAILNVMHQRKVILEFYKWNINSLSKKEKVRKYDVNRSLNQTWFVFFGQTIAIGPLKL